MLGTVRDDRTPRRAPRRRNSSGVLREPSDRPCRAFVGGFGRPGMRDCDFGRQVIDCLQQLDWPQDVVVEELSCAVPLVLHRLQELRPVKVVLLAAVPRRLDPPGTLRRYRVDRTRSAPEEIHRGLEESVMGLVDLDHTLAVARHWGELPVDTVVIEVEPADTSFGLGFSDEMAACIDPILDMVREELGGLADGVGLRPDFVAAQPPMEAAVGAHVLATDPRAEEPSEAMTELVGYARDHSEARLQSAEPRRSSMGWRRRFRASPSPGGSDRGASSSTAVATGSTPCLWETVAWASWWATWTDGAPRWRRR